MPRRSKADRQLLDAIYALMREYGISRIQLLKILGCNPSRLAVNGPAPRPLQAYRNPHTGTSIRVRSNRSLVYRAWVSEYGEEAVAGWAVEPCARSAGA